jgi:hypothetical protein
MGRNVMVPLFMLSTTDSIKIPQNYAKLLLLQISAYFNLIITVIAPAGSV